MKIFGRLKSPSKDNRLGGTKMDTMRVGSIIEIMEGDREGEFAVVEVIKTNTVQVFNILGGWRETVSLDSVEVY